LASWIVASSGLVTVEQMADAAGVSRQCLSHRFREAIGVTPKLYSMLARFHAGLAHAGRGANVDWARASADLGYADQSHMIREFRRFSSLTPTELASGRWFHPFIARARSASMLSA
jgi:AraC-like DNA-binding protein